MAVSRDDARAAKGKVGAALRKAGGVVAVGLTKSGGGYALKVNLRDPAPQAALPREVDGVPIVYEVTGAIRPRGG